MTISAQPGRQLQRQEPFGQCMHLVGHPISQPPDNLVSGVADRILGGDTGNDQDEKSRKPFKIKDLSQLQAVKDGHGPPEEVTDVRRRAGSHHPRSSVPSASAESTFDASSCRALSTIWSS